MKHALQPFGWEVGPAFVQRYLTDPWVFNLANAVVRLTSEVERLRAEAREEYARAQQAETALVAAKAEIERLRALYPEGPCPVGGTAPARPTTYDGGYWYDGGFHHCSCGAVVPWTAKPHEGGVVEPHNYRGEDQRLRALNTPAEVE